eukprot:TRINITY_DN46118_c0_g1_i1.p1 TRINITY_DN46118_c0_g1~~TRINITY_DN46118_c0_g1_i1.p1  ORF type:complete len:116 (-),score=8.60 TRINITY_DN46118_c0_g1_i1:455-802(-)
MCHIETIRNQFLVTALIVRDVGEFEWVFTRKNRKESWWTRFSLALHIKSISQMGSGETLGVPPFVMVWVPAPIGVCAQEKTFLQESTVGLFSLACISLSIGWSSPSCRTLELDYT